MDTTTKQDTNTGGLDMTPEKTAAMDRAIGAAPMPADAPRYSYRVDAIVTDLSRHGLAFVTDPIHSDKRLLRADAPVVKLVDIDKFRATIDGADAIIKAAMDGSSLRVQAQRVVRDTLLAAPLTTNQALRELVIDRVILRNKADRKAPAPRIVEVETFMGMDGVAYATKLEARQANIAVLVTNGMTLEQAQEITKNMA